MARMTTEDFKKEISEIQAKARELTCDEFIAWIRKNCSRAVVYGDVMEFTYKSVKASINARYECLYAKYDVRSDTFKYRFLLDWNLP
jgi:hypothetical protein